MGVSLSFYAITWTMYRKASSAQRACFLVESPPNAVRVLYADPAVQQWKYAVDAGNCWEAMRDALDRETQGTYDEVFGALFWESAHGPREHLPELGARLSLDPDSVVTMYHSLMDPDVDGLEPFFEACCPRDGRFRSFDELRQYLAAWATLLARVQPHEGLIGV